MTPEQRIQSPTHKLAEAIPTYLPTLNHCSTDNQTLVSIKSSTTVEGPTGIKEMSCLNKPITKTQQLTQ